MFEEPCTIYPGNSNIYIKSSEESWVRKLMFTLEFFLLFQDYPTISQHALYIPSYETVFFERAGREMSFKGVKK